MTKDAQKSTECIISYQNAIDERMKWQQTANEEFNLKLDKFSLLGKSLVPRTTPTEFSLTKRSNPSTR